MKKALFLTALLCLGAVVVAQAGKAALAAQEASSIALNAALVDEAGRMRYTEDKSPVTAEERSTVEELRSLGRHLAKGSASDGKYLAARYTGADVIYIGKEANVTTTRCLFLIVAGYLEASCAMPQDEAYSAAEHIAWWNSEHYGDAAYFKSLLGEGVLNAFADKTEAIGLSKTYKDWAGSTRIIIPWSSGEGSKANAQNAAAGDGGIPIAAGANRAPQGVNDAAGESIEDAQYVPKDAPSTAAEGAFPQKLSLTNGFMMLLAMAGVGILMLVMLLIKVIMDLARDRG